MGKKTDNDDEKSKGEGMLLPVEVMIFIFIAAIATGTYVLFFYLDLPSRIWALPMGISAVVIIVVVDKIYKWLKRK